MSEAVSYEVAPRMFGIVDGAGSPAFDESDGNEICRPGIWLSTRITWGCACLEGLCRNDVYRGGRRIDAAPVRAYRCNGSSDENSGLPCEPPDSPFGPRAPQHRFGPRWCRRPCLRRPHDAWSDVRKLKEALHVGRRALRAGATQRDRRAGNRSAVFVGDGTVTVAACADDGSGAAVNRNSASSEKTKAIVDLYTQIPRQVDKQQTPSGACRYYYATPRRFTRQGDNIIAANRYGEECITRVPFAQEDSAALFALMDASRLVTLVTAEAGVPSVSHVPVLVDKIAAATAPCGATLRARIRNGAASTRRARRSPCS